MHAGREKRKHKRIDKQVVTNFQVIPEGVQEDFFPRWDMTKTQNVSAGGVLVDYNKKVEIDSYVHLKLNLPESETPINCVGKVVRVEEKQDSPTLSIAVAFTEISDQERKTLDSLT
ncbi:PilZ domain-containing protein [Candidatus Omnitrophota bacterium]